MKKQSRYVKIIIVSAFAFALLLAAQMVLLLPIYSLAGQDGLDAAAANQKIAHIHNQIHFVQLAMIPVVIVIIVAVVMELTHKRKKS